MGRKSKRKRKASVPCPQCQKPIPVQWPDTGIDYQDVKCPRCRRVYVRVWQEVSKDAVRVGPCNATVLMTGGVPDRTGKLPGASVAVPTCDRADRAHNVQFSRGGLFPTRRLAPGLGTFRRYHPDYMVTVVVPVMVEGKRRLLVKGDVSFETQFELTGERERRLEEDGVFEPNRPDHQWVRALYQEAQR